MSDVLLVNPLPWERAVAGPIAPHVVRPRGEPGDPTAARHYQDRSRVRLGNAMVSADTDLDPFGIRGSYLLESTRVPGYGYRTVSADRLVEADDLPFDERTTVQTDRHRVRFDRERGGIERWYDRERGREWVDRAAEYPLAGFVHERVADDGHPRPRRLLARFPREEGYLRAAGVEAFPRPFQPDWHARRRGPEEVRRHRVYRTPLGYEVRQRLDAPGIEGDVDLRVHVPDDDGGLLVEVAWTMGLETHPEATYLAFPFAIDDPVARVDVGGQAMRPGVDQLPGSCHDFYTVQRWAALSNDGGGMTVGCPLNPLVQFGDFSFAADRRTVALERATLLGWITNNYWDTNFRARQPGTVRARYHLRPHDGPFDEGRAHRVGFEAAHHEPLVGTLAEPPVAPGLPSKGSFLDLPEPPVLALQVRPADGGDGAAFVLLRNAADGARRASVGSALLGIEGAEAVGLLGERTGEALPVADGAVEVDLGPRETAALRLELGVA